MAHGTHTVLGISLREALPDAEFIGADDLRATSCSADSRYCRPGDLFVAFPSQNLVAHVAEAERAGAVAILADQPLPGCRLPVCLVLDVARAYAEICHALVGRPSRQLKVIAVAGTHGKTTITHLIASILYVAGAAPGYVGTLGISDGQQLESTAWSTPPAPVLAAWLARCEAVGCTHAVMEISPEALAQRWTAAIDFDVVCLTGALTSPDMPTSCLRPAQLFEQLLPEGFTILNADDETCESWLAQLTGPVLTVGQHAKAEISATPLEQFPSEQTFLLHVGQESVPVRTRLIGRHNIDNCLAAVAVGMAYGIDLATIVRGIEMVEGVVGRMERVECGQPFSVFVDSARTGSSLRHVLQTLRDVTRGQVICVFGAAGGRDRRSRAQLGAAAEMLADRAIITSDNPRADSPESITSDILRGCRAPSEIHVALDRREAIRAALAEARPGDCVLIAGKGHETEQIIGHERFPFDDREVARECLQELWKPAPLKRAA